MPFTRYIGGTGDADLWIVTRTNVLICQYQNADDYVSYLPPSSVLYHAKGKLGPHLPAMSVEELPSGARDMWGQYEDLTADGTHKPKEIARYLAIFYPDAFSEAEREEALGLTLTEQGEMK